MISAIIFLLYTALLFVIPTLEYRQPKLYHRLMTNMSYTINGHKFLACLLAILVTFFHLVYFSAFPASKAIMISTLFVFFLLSTKRTIQALRLTNRSMHLTLILALACILCAFVPFLFTSAVSMAFFLQIACVLPPSSEDAVIDDNCEDSQSTSESIQTSDENKLSDTSL